MNTRSRLIRLPSVAAAIAVTCAACQVGALVDSGTPPGPADGTHVVFLTQPTSTTTGSDITPTVQVQVVDSSGSAMTQYDGRVTIRLTHDGSVLQDASLQGTTTVNASNGVASFENLHIDKTGVGYTLGAGVPSGGAPAVSQPFDVVPL